MKTMIPDQYKLKMNEFDEIKATLLIDDKQRYYSNLLKKDVVFDEKIVEEIKMIINDGFEPMIEYKDGEFLVSVIEL